MSLDEKVDRSDTPLLGNGGIVVIADDFSGAAELAGIALRYGLSVELCVNEVRYKKANVLIVSTDSRSITREVALLRTATAINKVLELKPSLIYKKIDSVLRGYVVDELKLQMQLMGRNRGIIMPANPALGRTIKNGEYFIDGIRINETGFANDPEFPVKSSLVKEMLGKEIEVLGSSDALTGKNIVVGEASNSGDYHSWVEKLDESWVLAGAGDFFTAILEKNHSKVELASPQLQQPFLYVCGTAYRERKEAIKEIGETKQCVCYLKDDNNEELINTAAGILKSKRQLILAFDDETIFSATAAELRRRMASVVRQLIEKEEIKELFIEGGSTAAAILQELDLNVLEPVNELSRGVVTMKADNLFITVKPGSYKLPEEVTRLFTI